MIYSIRSTIMLLFLGLLAWAVTPNQACHTTSLPDSDEITQGPFWIDSLLNRSNVTEGKSGTPLTLTLRVWNKTTITAACAATATGTDSNTPITDGVGALQGVQVDIWHADATGVYSDFSSEGTAGQTYLRGYQLTNSTGYVTFQTIIPGWYTSRTVHIHIRIRIFITDATSNQTTTYYDDTTQLFFSDTASDAIYAANSVYNHGTRDTYNTNDNLYQSVMVLDVTGTTTTGYSSVFNLYYPFVTVSSSTTATTTNSSSSSSSSSTGGVRNMAYSSTIMSLYSIILAILGVMMLI